MMMMFKAWKLAYHLTFPNIYFPTLLPELYALPHPNFFKFHAPTSSLAHALFMYLLTLSGTHCLTAFVSVNL